MAIRSREKEKLELLLARVEQLDRGLAADIRSFCCEELNKASASQRETEENLRQVLSGDSDNFYMVDRGYQVTLINEAAQRNLLRAWGHRVGVGTNILDVIPHDTTEPIRSSFARVFLGEQVDYDLSINKHGLPEWVRVSYSPVKDEDGFVKSVYVATRNISERKRAEQEKKEVEARFKTLVDKCLVGVYMIQNDRFVYINPSFAEIFGFSQEELIRKMPVMDLVLEEDRPFVESNLRSRLDYDIESLRYEFRGIKKDGSVIWVEAFGSRTRLKGGIAVIGTLIDITERRKSNESVRESEAKYRILVENAPEALVVYDLVERRMVNVSESACRLFRMSQEELLTKGPEELSPVYQPDGRRSDVAAMEKLQEALVGAKPSFEWMHKDSEGKLIPCEVRLVRLPSENRQLVRGSLVDITERKRIEKEKEKARYELKERIKELTTLYKSGQLVQSEDLSINEVLQQIVSILPGGWRYSDIAAARIVVGDKEYRTANYVDGPHKQLSGFITSDNIPGFVEIVYLEERPDEIEGPFVTEERKMINMHSEMIRIFLNRRNAENALHESQANLNAIFHTTDTVYALADKDLRLVSYNDAAVKFAREELGLQAKLGSSLSDYFPASRHAELIRRINEVLSGRAVNYEAKYVQPDGSLHWYDVKIFPTNDKEENVSGFLLAMTNLTEKKALEQRMLAQRIREQRKITRAMIEAEEKERNKIGQELHDNVNQILASTNLYLAIARDHVEERLEFVEKSIELLNSAIQEIRLLSHQHVTPLKRINLKDIIQSLANELARNAGLDISVQYNVPLQFRIDNDLKLNIYRILQELLNNILKHSRATEVNIYIEVCENYLRMAVTDNGVGFDVRKKKKGIGIANIINRVESYNGEIQLQSEPDKGCRIDITVPLT
ncbi:PAS domain S-box protein [Flavihumibacter solisilvae]|nr:PAS domain S-box protein [Flavihumibacter solisilvae]